MPKAIERPRTPGKLLQMPETRNVYRAKGKKLELLELREKLRERIHKLMKAEQELVAVLLGYKEEFSVTVKARPL